MEIKVELDLREILTAKTGMLKEGLAKNFLETGNIGGE